VVLFFRDLDISAFVVPLFRKRLSMLIFLTAIFGEVKISEFLLYAFRGENMEKTGSEKTPL
jgi:hypothetical protein